MTSPHCSKGEGVGRRYWRHHMYEARPANLQRKCTWIQINNKNISTCLVLGLVLMSLLHQRLKRRHKKYFRFDKAMVFVLFWETPSDKGVVWCDKCMPIWCMMHPFIEKWRLLASSKAPGGRMTSRRWWSQGKASCLTAFVITPSPQYAVRGRLYIDI